MPLGLNQLPAILLITALLLTAPRAHAQQQPSDAIPIEAILMRLQLHVWAYDRSLPDFFAEEHVLSTRSVLHQGIVHNTTDSIFRLRRTSAPGVTPPTLTESHEVKAIDGRPAHGESITGPAIFSGAFSSALLIVSMELRHCFDYRIEPPGHLHRAPAIVIDFALKSSALADSSCYGPELHSGRAWIDPQTFQLRRIEMRIPNHRLDDGSHALWTWSVDYAPFTLDGKLFSLPRTIASAADANDGSAQWTFTATYRNYHKTNVTSRIITNLDAPQNQ